MDACISCPIRIPRGRVTGKGKVVSCMEPESKPEQQINPTILREMETTRRKEKSRGRANYPISEERHDQRPCEEKDVH